MSKVLKNAAKKAATIVAESKANAVEGKATTVAGIVLGVASTLGFINPIIPAVAGALALVFGVGKKTPEK